MFEKKRLPDEMISEILLRVPVKSLVRFKSACKLWQSLISDPKFTKSHFDLAAAPTERLLLIASPDKEILSLDFNASLFDRAAVVPLTSPIEIPELYSYRNIEILGSCRGFLLLEISELRCFCMWNPSTRVHMKIPYSPISSKSRIFLEGFGYDPSTDDYLVVQALYPVDDKGSNRVQFFSLKANSWIEIEDAYLPYKKMGRKYILTCRGSLLNNTIHWLVLCWYKEFENEEAEEEEDIPVILAFDLKKRRFSELPLPIDYKYDYDQINALTVLGDLLGLCSVVGGSLQIWAMEEYKVQSSWTKTLLVSLDVVPRNILTVTRIGFTLPPRRYDRFLEVICSTKSGGIVGRDDGTGLVKFNDNGELQEHQSYQYYFKSRFWVAARYTQSLLSLPITQQTC